jgi:hypothetical protein
LVKEPPTFKDAVEFVYKHKGKDFSTYSVLEILAEVKQASDENGIIFWLDRENNIRGIIIFTDSPTKVHVRHLVTDGPNIIPHFLQNFIDRVGGRILTMNRHGKFRTVSKTTRFFHLIQSLT